MFRHRRSGLAIKQPRQIAQDQGVARMIRTVGCFIICVGTLVERLGQPGLILKLIEPGDIIEDGCDAGLVEAASLLQDIKSAHIELLGLAQAERLFARRMASEYWPFLYNSTDPL